MPPQLSVVVPAHNAAKTLGEQLDALVATGFEDMEVIVVDNRSTDDTAQLARRWKGELNLRVIDAPAVASAGHARNVGLHHASSELIAMCDADDRVAGSWPAAMVRALADHPYVTGPLELDALNDEASIAARGRGWCSKVPLALSSIPFANGCNMGLRRSLIADIGPFREDLGVIEDIEFGIRAWEHGHSPVLVPEAQVQYRLRSGHRAIFTQARAYARTTKWQRERCAGAFDLKAEVRSSRRRRLWLLRNLALLRRRPGQLRWLWVAGTAIGELQGWDPESVPTSGA